MMSKFQPATLHIDLSALRHNLKQIKQQAPSARVWAALKADAYGHGLIPVAQALEEANGFALARFTEALALRQAGITKPILLLEGVFSPEELLACAQLQFEIVIHTREQLDMLWATPTTTPLQVWLKIDSGMGRLGFRPEEVASATFDLLNIEHINKPIHFLSHFSSADEWQNNHTAEQIHTFMQVLPPNRGAISLANSAGIFAWPQSHADWIRPGLSLYGVSPFADKTAQDLNLKPVMHARAPLIAVRKVKTGESIGYNQIWTASTDTYIGVIALGYADGYPRNTPKGTPVLINRQRFPVVGRVSMDMLTVNLGSNTHVRVGDMATLWGEGLPIEEVAHWQGTIPYELLTQTGARYQRQMTDNQSSASLSLG